MKEDGIRSRLTLLLPEWQGKAIKNLTNGKYCGPDVFVIGRMTGGF